MEVGVSVPRLRVGCLADVGIGREHQEDSIGYASLYEAPTYGPLAQERGNLYVLADGAGGHEAGDIASEMAVLGTLKFYYHEPFAGTEEAILQAIRHASHRIGHYAANTGVSARTTLVCVVLQGNELCTVNVGDSRAYLIRNGQAIQLSEDHTLVARWVREGQVTGEQAREHSYRHVVTQALGGTEEVQPSVHWEEILPGDAIVLCSDGLYGVVEDDAIARAVSHAPEPQTACEQLVDLANGLGGPDNISVVVVHVEQVDVQQHVAASQEADAVPVPVFERQGNGVITLRLDPQDPKSKRQARSQSSIMEKLSALFERR